MSTNPYTLVFGREPRQVISRGAVIAEVLESFEGDPPAQQVFLITGVRGSGKTVLMTEIANRLRGDKDWVVVELSPERDMLQSLAAKLGSRNELAGLFRSAKINLSFLGIGLEAGGDTATDIEIMLERMLESLKKRGKRVLVMVDEAVSTKNMRVFASVFQMLIRQDLPLFLVMTGLFSNIRKLQDEKTLTFLYRAPRIELRPLNIGTIAKNYQKVFGIDDEKALNMAKMTKGYSFAFQVLGYVTWEHHGLNEDTITDYKQYLDEYAYEKIWSELSRTDQKVAAAIARSKTGKVSEVRQILGMENSEFNPYRDRLKKRGVIDGSTYGEVRFTLPLFDRFVIEQT